MEVTPRKRAVGYLGVVLAALASLATSQPSWEVEDRIPKLSDTLSAAELEVVHHFSVESSAEHTVRVSGTLTWDLNPAAVVRVSIAKDDGSPAQEQVYRADDQGLIAPGRRRNTVVSLGQHQECSAKPCLQGYSVTFRLEDGAPQEKVKMDWAFSASMAGEGDDAPEGAYVKLVED